MYKRRSWLWVTFLILAITACSNNDTNESAEDMTGESTESAKLDDSANGLSDSPSGAEMTKEEAEATEGQEDRMMVYEAHIDLETKDYDQFYQSLEKRMKEHGAYMVETSIRKTERGNREGHIRLRVPQPNFAPLLGDFGDISDNIKSRNINSRDVTKNYVDLESRLKAQEEIETRLLSFLEEADATEDLIKISQDLERVQSEIESIKGEMNYLENQSDFSTVTLSIKETKVVVPEVDRQQLNTWEKTKQAFFSSINGLASFFSWLTVIVVGYSPIIGIILAIAGLIWLRQKKKSMKRNKEAE